LLLAVERFGTGDFRPQALDCTDPHVRGELRPAMRQAYREARR
jgi:putative two-component system hydrogenase maturation factor HypX/HoxX